MAKIASTSHFDKAYMAYKAYKGDMAYKADMADQADMADMVSQGGCSPIFGFHGGVGPPPPYAHLCILQILVDWGVPMKNKYWLRLTFQAFKSLLRE